MSRPLTYAQKEPAGEWSVKAACRQSYGTHFPTAPVNTELHRRQVALAQSMCDICPVTQECYDLAIRNKERDGIWGGVIFQQGARARRRLIQLAT